VTTPWGLALRHIREHWFRNLLTVGAVAVAAFLFCFLVSLIVTLDSQVEESSQNRLVVQSSVSLFVTLPIDYHPKIAEAPGVAEVTKWQWFGGYYQKPENFFAQFGLDPEPFFRMYTDDIAIVAGPEMGTKAKPKEKLITKATDATPERREAVLRAMLAEKRGVLIGKAVAEKFGWRVGDTIPLIGTIFPRADGGSWEFQVIGIFEKRKANVDEQTMFFRFDYLEEALRQKAANGPLGSGTYFVQVARGADPSTVIAGIDALFANGPQRTKTSTEAAFQQSFVSMLGNLPFFLGTIGGAVVFAVFFSVVNAMLISGRQRLRESGILKALGFRDRAIGALIVYESVLLTGGGGVIGVALAFVLAEGLRKVLSNFFPNFIVEPRTMALGLAISLAIGVVAGITPMVQLIRTKPTEALRSVG